MFLNSQRLAAIVCLLADTIMLLRAQAMVKGAMSAPDLLSKLRPNQLTLDLE